VSVAFIDANRYRWPVSVMCEVLGLAERTYYAARTRAPSARQLADEATKVEIRRVWETNYRAYGSKRVWLTLRREGHPVARCTVERLMADMGIAGVQRGRRPRTTTPDTAAPRSPDLVDRRFVAERPDELWVTDITYVSTWEGWMYVAFVLDVYSRVIVGWQIASHLRTELVLDAIEMAIWRRDTSVGLTCHSDAGCQGGLNWSSQHLDDGGVVHGNDERATAAGAVVSGADPIARCADGRVARGSRSVLGGHRPGREDRRGGCRGGRVLPGRVSVVPARWWCEPMPSPDSVGPLPVVL
jgi:transposase InsO family protein